MNPIFTRVSTREFLDKQISDEQITLLLKAAMQAPSARNGQPWEFYVVTNKDVRANIANASPFGKMCEFAPLVIVPCFRKETISPLFHDIDLAASVENILLEAETLGLGAVWVGVSPIEERINSIREILSIPSSLVPFCLIPIGYKAKTKEQTSRFDESRIHYVK